MDDMTREEMETQLQELRDGLQSDLDAAHAKIQVLVEERDQAKEELVMYKRSSRAGFWRNLAELLKVKSLGTVVVVAVYAVLALTHWLPVEIISSTTMTVIAFYYGRESMKGKVNRNE